MLGKLMKYEMKATVRVFGPMLILLAAFAALNRIMYSGTISRLMLTEGNFVTRMIMGLMSAAYFFIVCGVFVVTLIVLIQRFYKNLMGDEGYLMFTLPVKPWQHIVAKSLVASLWIVVNIIAVIFFTTFMMGGLMDLAEGLREFSRAYRELCSMELAGISPTVFTLEIILVVLVALLGQMLPVYCAIAAGGVVWKKHRILGAIAAYMVLTFATQIITAIILHVAGKILEPYVWNYGWLDTTWPIHLLMIGTMVLTAAFSAGYFALTNHILTRRLDLE